MKIPDWLMPEPYFKRALTFIIMGFLLTLGGFFVAAISSLINNDFANILVIVSVVIFTSYQVIAFVNIVVGLITQIKKEWKE